MRALPLLILATVLGCDAKPNPTPATAVGAVLGPGDPAPPLAVTQWLHGGAVELKPGTVYVVDFWATWCGPCLQSMPHLDALAREFGPKGLEVIAVTTKDDQGNTLDRAEKFIKDTGHRYAIHFAWCDDEPTHNAWMEAAGRGGIPCSFVIGRDGKIAYIGHPNELDDILPRVLDGTWKGRATLVEIDDINRRKHHIFNKVKLASEHAQSKLPVSATESQREAASNAAATLAAPLALEELAKFEAEHPAKAGTDDVLLSKMMLLMRVKKYKEAKAIAEKLLKHCQASSDVYGLDMVRQDWLRPALNPDRKHLDLAVTAAEMMLEIYGETSLKATLAAAESYAAVGNMEKFDFYARRARMLTALDAKQAEHVEAELKKFRK